MLGLILSQMVAASSMWEYPEVVVQILEISLVSKNMHLAVQQYAWPKLLDMLGPSKPEYLTRAEQPLSELSEELDLPEPLSLDSVVSAPASLTAATLKAICKALSLNDTGGLLLLCCLL